MEVKEKSVKELKPYAKNAKKHDKTQIANVAKSIEKYGFVQPIVIDRENVIVIGHCRYEAAKKLKLDKVPCVCVDDLTPEEINALRLVDNKSNESEWDMDILPDELKWLDLSDFDFDWGIKEEPEENPYTTAVNVPQYEIKGDIPALYDLYDDAKEKELIEEIEKSSVSQEEKGFLISAAHRHCRYNFANIAEYYAHASEEMQRLMERSALVIIDLNNAIANGYVKLSKTIEVLRDDE